MDRLLTELRELVELKKRLQRIEAGLEAPAGGSP